MFGKLIFIAIIVLLIYWIIRGKQAKKEKTELLPDEIENMVCCKHCGMHLPESESITAQGVSFCCNDHQQKYLHSKQ